MIIAILDNYQQADGSVLVPPALVALMGKERLTPKPSRPSTTGTG
jgi:seryl-tRNA synthetase